jgi:hypothetical protein
LGLGGGSGRTGHRGGSRVVVVVGVYRVVPEKEKEAWATRSQRRRRNQRGGGEEVRHVVGGNTIRALTPPLRIVETKKGTTCYVASRR